MGTRYFALIAGIFFLVIGVAGFFSGFRTEVPPGAPDVVVDAAHGYLFGLFPVNALHNLVHIAIGIWGIFAYRAFNDSVRFSKGLAGIYVVLAIMGIFPVLNTTFGLIPLHSNDIWLHAGTAIIAAYFGWGKRERMTTSIPDRRFDDHSTTTSGRPRKSA